MLNLKPNLKYFSKADIILWCSSVSLIVLSFCIFDKENYLTLIASLVGITSLIFIAKGNPFGQLLMVFFSMIYGIISYACAYYGEMITYVGMSLPMALFALASWLRNPYGKRAEVKVSTIGKKEPWFICLLTVIVTTIFYFVLKHFNTANLIVSTFSISTSFIAVYLTFRRSPYFALAYALNDIVLIVLWTLASISDSQYISVVVCFFAFLANDIYGFISWLKMKNKQSKGL